MTRWRLLLTTLLVLALPTSAAWAQVQDEGTTGTEDGSTDGSADGSTDGSAGTDADESGSGSGTATAGDEGLTAATGTPSAAPGERIWVEGSGWPVGELLQLVTCGELGVGGSRTCDQTRAIATPVREDGSFRVRMVVGEPPVACPCVVKVATVAEASAAARVDVPFSVAGHPNGDIPTLDSLRPRLEVEAVELRGSGPFLAYFGAAPRRTLEVTVRNAGGASSPAAPMLTGWGRDPGGIEREFDPVTLEPLEPGMSATVAIPATLPIAAMGTYHVAGALPGLEPFDVAVTHQPWGLFVLNALALVLVVLAVRWRLVRRATSLREQQRLQTAGPLGESLDGIAPDIVYVSDLGAYLVFEDARAARRLRGRSGASLAFSGVAAGVAVNGHGDADGGASNAVIDTHALSSVLVARYGAPEVGSEREDV